jgi:hypothetical protein
MINMRWIVRIVVVVAIAFLGLEINRLNDALTSCLSDVQNECGGVIDYAISLEDENAKISRQLKECREK